MSVSPVSPASPVLSLSRFVIGLSIACFFSACDDAPDDGDNSCSLDAGPAGGPSAAERVAAEQQLPLCNSSDEAAPENAQLEWIAGADYTKFEPIDQQYTYGGLTIRLVPGCVTAWTYPGCLDIPYINYDAEVYASDGQQVAVIPFGESRDVPLPSGQTAKIGNTSSGDGIYPDDCPYCAIGIFAQARLFVVAEQ